MELPINILIVDDEPKNLTVLETVLDDPSYRLVRAESADKALLALVADEFALLILDIRMPDTTGFELAQIIKQRRKTARVPIIFLTAYYNEDQHVLEGYDLGAVDYLHKPVNAPVLRSKVAVFAELHRKQQESLAANQALMAEVNVRRRVEEQLRELNETLDQRVAERTEALRKSQVSEQLLRAEADAANRAKDIFLATLSHEMRTPLNAIVGWMGILRRDECRDEDLREGLDVIDRNTKAQVQLIEDVLDVSRIVSGKLRLEIRTCEPTEAIKAGIDVVRAAAQARDIALDVRIDDGIGHASCDSVRIQQVMWNLLSNAVKFTPKGGRVCVVFSREPSCLLIQVSDNGQGISPELLPFVFDRFRQADSSTRRRFGGLGLGLSIVRHIVELHGGTVEAHSDGEGKGSTFTVRLPIRAAPLDGRTQTSARDMAGASQGHGEDVEVGDGPNEAASAPLVRLDGLRVLAVDDEPDARRLLTKLLESAGAIVTAVGSAREAIQSLFISRPDILVSDLGMPEQDGFDLIRQVRAEGFHFNELPAVALTAYVQNDDQREALSAGFQVHISKPVDPHQLTAAIASLTGRTV